MSNDESDAFELTRRKTLAALGTIGAASAGAGLGTSAFFSDEETFTNNTLTAGELDLKVDWEEHYSDWSDDEAQAVDGNVEMTNGNAAAVPEGYVGLPDPMHPLIAVPSDMVTAFMNATSVEAYPDADDDGAQDQNEGGNPVFPNADSICDVDADLGEALASDLRTSGHGQESENGPEPLVNLTDVKPGDFGELTLSFHICDNPGYVWMWGKNFSASENGLTEPEADDQDEDDEAVELLDAIQTVAWYDDSGDNVINTQSESQLCVQLVLDSSGSMDSTDNDSITRNTELKNGAKKLVESLKSASVDATIGLTEFDDDANVLVSVADDASESTLDTQIDSIDASGGTDIAGAIQTADEDLANCPDDSRAVQVVVTDGQSSTDPAPAADDVTGSDSDDYTDEIFAVGTGGATQSSLETFARPVDDAHIELTEDLTTAISNLTGVLGGEEIFFRGSLRELRSALTTAQGNGNVPGIPLDGNRTSNYDEVPGDGMDDGQPSGPGSEERQPFVASNTQHIGLAWYLPVDHANEIQSDGVSFDLGFYTEQARHNSGAGMAPETTTTSTPTSTPTPTQTTDTT